MNTPHSLRTHSGIRAVATLAALMSAAYLASAETDLARPRPPKAPVFGVLTNPRLAVAFWSMLAAWIITAGSWLVVLSRHNSERARRIRVAQRLTVVMLLVPFAEAATTGLVVHPAPLVACIP